jgi:hypothetical protein
MRATPLARTAVTIVGLPIRSTKEPLVSTQIPSRPATSSDQRESPWASGLTVVAATFLVIAGVWHVLAGISAVVHDDVYVATPEYIYSFDLTAWGWVHILLGVLGIVAGFAVLKGQMWARVVGIILASLSMIANFGFLPHYPLWSILIIVLDAGIIWALATYRREAV